MVSAFLAAADAHPREQDPAGWARIHYRLGHVFLALAERQDERGRLIQGAAAYRAAVEALSPDHQPLEWAKAQLALGGAFYALGVVAEDAERLEKSIAASLGAAEVFERLGNDRGERISRSNVDLAKEALASLKAR